VHPAAVAGHGVGEIAAAQVAGVLTAEEAAELAARPGDRPAAVRQRAGTVPLFSTRAMDWVDAAALDGGHWLPDPQQEPALPAEALAQALVAAGYGAYVEVGPDPQVTAALAQAAAAVERGAGDREGAPVVIATLRGEESGLRTFTSALAALYVRGVSVDWAAVLGGGRRVDLPTYAFQRQRYWPQPPAATAAPAAPAPSAAGAAAPDEQRFWAALAAQDMTALTELLGAGEPLRADMPLGAVLERLAAWRRESAADAPAGPSGSPVGTPADDAGGAGEQGAPEGGAHWRQRLAEVTPAERQELLSELVRQEIAVLLGYDTCDAVPQYADVFELGMTSMSAVQLRERMNELTGLTLPEGFVYDLYMPEAIAEFLLGELAAALREGTPEDR
jgi:acyl transferase domain-containing protein